jgi:hypothetical protein
LVTNRGAVGAADRPGRLHMVERVICPGPDGSDSSPVRAVDIISQKVLVIQAALRVQAGAWRIAVFT